MTVEGGGDVARSALDGKVALITGGTSGIGQATALAFARRGARVAVAGRNSERGAAVVAQIQAVGAEALFVPVDVSNAFEVETMVPAVVERFGRLDIAFNNAGYQEPRALLAEQPAATYDTVFDTNLRAVFLAMQAEIRAMLPTGGVIVNNASVSGVRNPNPGLALYCASKAAVISMTKSAAMEYADKGIRIQDRRHEGRRGEPAAEADGRTGRGGRRGALARLGRLVICRRSQPQCGWRFPVAVTGGTAQAGNGMWRRP